VQVPNRYASTFEVLEKFDQDKVKLAKASATESVHAGHSFKAAYSEKATALHLAASVKSKDVAYKPWPGIDQVEAKKYIPQGTSIWRGVVRDEWCAHCEPNPRLCERFVDHGGDSCKALEALLQQLWEQFLFKYGLSQDACTVKGLFKIAVAEP
jgi:hypothetical protein